MPGWFYQGVTMRSFPRAGALAAFALIAGLSAIIAALLAWTVGWLGVGVECLRAACVFASDW